MRKLNIQLAGTGLLLVSFLWYVMVFVGGMLAEPLTPPEYRNWYWTFYNGSVFWAWTLFTLWAVGVAWFLIVNQRYTKQFKYVVFAFVMLNLGEFILLIPRITELTIENVFGLIVATLTYGASFIHSNPWSRLVQG